MFQTQDQALGAIILLNEVNEVTVMTSIDEETKTQRRQGTCSKAPQLGREGAGVLMQVCMTP